MINVSETNFQCVLGSVRRHNVVGFGEANMVWRQVNCEVDFNSKLTLELFMIPHTHASSWIEWNSLWEMKKFPTGIRIRSDDGINVGFEIILITFTHAPAYKLGFHFVFMHFNHSPMIIIIMSSFLWNLLKALTLT